MSNFKFGLNYNDPPINLDNRQVFDARNITVAPDGKSIITDKGLINLHVCLNGSTILDIATTDKEVLLFCSDSIIRRYNIYNGDYKLCNRAIPITPPVKIAYSYNVKNELIIALTQYNEDPNVKVPLKVINLDAPFKDSILHDINPYKPIANITTVDILSEGASIRKGSYDFFISYKLDNDNYTDWVNIGSTIYVSDITESAVTSESHVSNVSKGLPLVTAVVTRPTNSKYENTNKTIKLGLTFNYIKPEYETLYDSFKLAYINTYDDKVVSKVLGIYDITDPYVLVNSNYMEDVSVEELTVSSPNIYNVKALSNYNNRLYIGNYEESNLDESFLSTLATEVYPIWKIRYLGNKLNSNLYKCNYSVENTYAISLSLNTLNEPLSPFNNEQYSEDATEYLKNIVGEDISRSNEILWKTYGTRYYETNAKGEIVNEYTTEVGSDTLTVVPINKIRLIITDDPDKPSYLSYVMVNASVEGARLYVELFIPMDTGSYQVGTPPETKLLRNIFTTGEIDVNSIDDRPSHDVLLNNRSLEPNEIYNFFIHYIAEDGSISKGFKINKFGTSNYNRLYSTGSNPSYFIVTTAMKDIQVDFSKYKDFNILNENANSTEPAYIYANNASLRTFNKNGIIDGYFGLFINSKGNNLYRCPDFSTYKHGVDTEQYVIDVDFENIRMPPVGYKGVMFSYEKVESSVTVSAISTDIDNDFIHSPYSDPLLYNKSRCVASELLLNPSLYTGSIVNNYAIVYQELEEYYKHSQLTNRDRKAYVTSKGTSYVYGLYNNFTNTVKTSIIPENDPKINRGRELCLRLEYIQPVYILESSGRYSVLQLLNINRSIYTSAVKDLVPLGYYRCLQPNSDNNNYNDKNVLLNLPSFNTMDYVYTYNKNGVYYADDVAGPLNINTDSEYWNINNVGNTYYNQYGTPYVQVSYNKFSRFYIPAEEVQDSAIEDKFVGIEYYDDHGNSKTRYVQRTTLSPTDSSNVVKLDESYILKIAKVFDNYNPNLIKSYIFNKSIRRSNVIASESTRNGWRFFNPEDYTVINEPRGDITNLIGIGNYLLCHCERSLFAFSKESTINADNKAIQLSGVDTFELPYQEVFTSEKGMCGLQNYFCNCIADGKYYWFDNNQATIYSWNSGSINMLSKDIDSVFLYGRRVNNDYVIHDWGTDSNKLLGSMAYDYPNKRVLMRLPTEADNSYNMSIVFEYSLMLDSIISYHVYPKTIKLCSTYNDVVALNMTEGLNLYVVNNKKYNSTNLLVEFGEAHIFNTDVEPYVDIIFTDKTDTSKVINYLNLKSDITYDIRFVEKIVIYSDSTCTGLLETPYDENWNIRPDAHLYSHYTGEGFNYNNLFNSIDQYYSIPSSYRLTNANTHTLIERKDIESLTGEPIHGKWFVVRLVMKPNNYYMINNVELDITKY